MTPFQNHTLKYYWYARIFQLLRFLWQNIFKDFGAMWPHWDNAHVWIFPTYSTIISIISGLHFFSVWFLKNFIIYQLLANLSDRLSVCPFVFDFDFEIEDMNLHIKLTLVIYQIFVSRMRQKILQYLFWIKFVVIQFWRTILYDIISFLFFYLSSLIWSFKRPLCIFCEVLTHVYNWLHLIYELQK